MKNAFKPRLRNAVLTALFVAPTALAQTKPSGDITSDTAKSTPDVPPTKEQCIESHRQSQQAQNVGRFVHAREMARTCTSLACPGLLVSDCARWLADLEQRIPSVVFEVRLDGKPNREAYVVVDGKPVAEWTRGEAFRIDPGEHQFRFELPNHEPIIQNLLLAEGMRFRVVSAEFKTVVEPTAEPASTAKAPETTPATPEPPKERPTPFVVYPLLGVGALGIASFATFAFLGSAEEDDLKKKGGCSPDCKDSDLSPMKTKYLVGDISLGVGAASLIAAGVFYFTRPEKDAPTTTIGFTPTPGGFSGFASYRF